jgi:hypothetical protein
MNQSETGTPCVQNICKTPEGGDQFSLSSSDLFGSSLVNTTVSCICSVKFWWGSDQLNPHQFNSASLSSGQLTGTGRN